MYKIYVAGPITVPSPKENAIIAIGYADRLLDLGYAPFLPHLSVFWEEHGKKRDDGNYGKGYELWMKLDFEWILQCNALLRIPGFSKGADREMKWAFEHSIPVFYNIPNLRNYFERRNL